MNKKSFLLVFTLLITILILYKPDIVVADTMTAGQIETSGNMPDSGVNGYDINNVDNTLQYINDEVEILKAILYCVRDIDIYLQYAVIMVFAGWLVWVTVLKPLLYFINI